MTPSVDDTASRSTEPAELITNLDAVRFFFTVRLPTFPAALPAVVVIETLPVAAKPAVLTVLTSKLPLLVSDTEPVLPASFWTVLSALFKV